MKKSHKLAVVAGVTTALIGGGVAVAFWTTSGTGTGTATTGDSSNFVVTTDAPVGPALAPGGTNEQTITFHVQNTNNGVQRLNSVAVSVANANGTAWTAVSGCSAADYVIAQHSVPASTDLVSNQTYTGVVTIKMKDTGVNQDGCKGVTVPLYVSAS